METNGKHTFQNDILKYRSNHKIISYLGDHLPDILHLDHFG